MKLSYNWLKEYVEINVDAYELADKLTHAGLEVEGVEKLAEGSNLVIGEVLECEPHPNSDHLSVTKVNVQDEVLQIVCGAPNVRKGLKVIVAKVGAKLPEITIKAAKVRDVESNGMLCSLLELGYDKKYLSEAQMDGIEELNADAPVGVEAMSYLKLNDYILDLKPTPNRKDALAMFNIAKEVKAILKTNITLPKLTASETTISTKLTLDIDDKCSKFYGQVINSVKVEASPKWLQEYLHASGIKSINNVVDISNYVMLETGQPLHFYDASKIENHQIGVKTGIKTKYMALDGIEYDIDEKDIMITNNNKPIGIAGIMGGDDSKIDENTTSIIIEAAIFDALSIRNTAKKLGLHTEATQRFTKGIEPLATKNAIIRAVEMLVKYANAKDIEEMVVVDKTKYTPTKLTVTLAKINKILGTKFTMEEVVEVLAQLDFNPVVNGDEINLDIPSYREDILILEDIAEEVIRLIGYDRLDAKLPVSMATVGQLSPKQKTRRLFKEILRGQGLNEIITYTLVSDDALKVNSLGVNNPLQILLPMSEARKNVRNSLMYSVLESLSYNTARKAINLNVFELSNVYGENKVEERLAIAISGSLLNSKLKGIDVKTDFYTLKGIVLSLLDKIGISKARVKIEANEDDIVNYHPYQSAVIIIDNQKVGIIGKVHPQLIAEFGLVDTYYTELNFDTLCSIKASKVKFKAIDKYPGVKRDIALIVEDEVSAANILKAVTTSTKLIKNAEIFDIYKGEHVKAGYKSIALSIEYQANDHTLTEEEINEAHTKVLNNLSKQCNAELRS